MYRYQMNKDNISIHALREEGDLWKPFLTITHTEISIHALREEGDLDILNEVLSGGISIHALREEGDVDQLGMCWLDEYFYPRPPRGGRQTVHAVNDWEVKYFYPRPPRGGRR